MKHVADVIQSIKEDLPAHAAPVLQSVRDLFKAAQEKMEGFAAQASAGASGLADNVAREQTVCLLLFNTQRIITRSLSSFLHAGISHCMISTSPVHAGSS